MKIRNLIRTKPILVLTFMCLSTSVYSQLRKDYIQKISKVIQTRLDSLTNNKVIPGATISIRFKDGTNISLASGLADVENKTPMKPDAVMFSGSVGKTYVAAVVLKLFEQGLVDLNAKAIYYLSNDSWLLKIHNVKDITVEMLLNHTAGIPEYVYHKELWQQINQNPDKIWSVEERLAFIKDEPETNIPGKGWAYADSHYLILGLIIEKITGKSYYEVLNELILKPCILNKTIPSNKRIIPDLIPGYTNLTADFLLPHKVLNDNKYAFNPQLEWTGGGLVTTVSDLTLWIKQLYGGNVLKPESKKLMLTPVPFKTTLFENAKYGLGCFIGETNGITYYGHTGFAPGYITYVQYIPKYDIALAFQFNDDSTHLNYSMKNFFNTLKNNVIENYK